MQPHILVGRAVDGDEAAFSELVRAHRNKMYAAALAITRQEQDALDAVQDAILKGWQKLSTLRQREYVGTWLVKIAIRCAINVSGRKKQTVPLLETVPSQGTDHARRMDVRKAIDGLDEKTRVCVTLFYLEDVPIADIAKMTGTMQGTVKSRLFRARAKLREVLIAYEE